MSSKTRQGWAGRTRGLGIAASAALAVGSVSAACGGTSGPRDERALAGAAQRAHADAAPRDAGPETSSRSRALTFVTFNAGLAPGAVDDPEARLPALEGALRSLEADVVCLQEVWLDAHAERLRGTLPHAARPAAAEPPAATAPTCTTKELDHAMACVTRACGGPDGHGAERGGDALAACAVSRCRAEATALSPSCLGCLMRDPRRSATEARAACGGATTPVSAARAVGAPPSGATTNALGGAKAYGGSHGLLLLSRTPLEDVSFTPLPAAWATRGVLHARTRAVEGAGEGAAKLDVYCTHLSAELPLGRPGGGTYRDERVAQLAALGRMLDARDASTPSGAEGSPLVLLGDFNVDPRAAAGATRGADLVAFDALRARELTGSIEAGLAGCTFCGDNPLVGGGLATARVLDHVLVRGFDPATLRATRLFDTNVVRLPAQPGAPARDVPLSEHYGVALRVAKP